MDTIFRGQRSGARCMHLDRWEAAFVVALANNDSVFATATLSSSVKWDGPFTVPNIKFVTLARPAKTNRLLAIGKSKGLYEISLNTSSVKTTQLMSFNATGLLAVKDEGRFCLCRIFEQCC